MVKDTFEPLKKRIKEIGVTEVSSRTGLSRSVVHNFASGKSSINSDNLEKIIKSLMFEVELRAPDAGRLLESVPCDPKKADQILAIARMLREIYSPKKIILFGSQARGDWNKNSDIDFLVIGFDRSVEAGEYEVEAFKRGIKSSFDVILASEKRIKEFKDDRSSVYSKALLEGVEIHV